MWRFRQACEVRFVRGWAELSCSLHVIDPCLCMAPDVTTPIFTRDPANRNLLFPTCTG